jgi:acyl-CoA synthetase (AMP-forming)/AMP-acid ligase II
MFQGRSFWHLVCDAAARAPERMVLADDYGRTLTTAGLRDAAERVAAGLPVRPGMVVSWQLPTTLEACVLMCALARLGAVQNPVIPVLREREVGLITKAVGTGLFITASSWRGFGHAEMGRGLGLDVIAVEQEADRDGPLRLPSGNPAALPAPPGPSPQCRWLYFSSGTTADPKGARHSDATIIAASNAVTGLQGMRDGDVYPIVFPITHIGGIAMLAAVLRAGGRLVMVDTWDPATTPERIAAHQPTILGSAQPIFRAYLDAQRRHREPLYPRLRCFVVGGAPTPSDMLHDLTESFSIELRLKGPQCFLGYVDRAQDAAAFDDEGWFRTGDLGEIGADGNIRITGRLKDVIIRNAENISAAEVEDVLRRHPGVADVAVIGLPDQRTGELVCAVAVPEPGHALTLAALAAHCAEHGMTPYKRPTSSRSSTSYRATQWARSFATSSPTASPASRR